jgi:uncharacterized damage-inducible protein DinB
VRAFLQPLRDNDMARPIVFTLGGKAPHVMALGDLLQHAALHAVHHRGQVALLLRELKCVPGNFDFLFYLAHEASSAQTA